MLCLGGSDCVETRPAVENFPRCVGFIACVSHLPPGWVPSLMPAQSVLLGLSAQLATEILTLVRGQDRPIPEKTISPAAVYEMFTRNSQCVLSQTGRCPLLVFTKQLCEELNEFFREDLWTRWRRLSMTSWMPSDAGTQMKRVTSSYGGLQRCGTAAYHLVYSQGS